MPLNPYTYPVSKPTYYSSSDGNREERVVIDRVTLIPSILGTPLALSGHVLVESAEIFSLECLVIGTHSSPDVRDYPLAFDEWSKLNSRSGHERIALFFLSAIEKLSKSKRALKVQIPSLRQAFGHIDFCTAVQMLVFEVEDIVPTFSLMEIGDHSPGHVNHGAASPYFPL